MGNRTGLQILRDLRLRENVILIVNKTGYPHLDKRHLQYYSIDAIAFGYLSFCGE